MGHFMHTNVDTVRTHFMEIYLAVLEIWLRKLLYYGLTVSNENYSQLGITCIIYNLG